MNHPISLKFNLINSACLVILLLIFGVYNYQANKSALMEQQTNQLDSSLGRLQQSVSSLVWNYETEQIKEIVLSELDNPSIHGIFVFDAEELLMGRLKDDQGNVAEGSLPEWADIRERQLIFVDGDEENIVGKIVMLVDSSELEQILTTSLLANLIQVVLMVVLFAVIGYILLKKVVLDPLLELRDTLKDIASGEGDLTRRIKIQRQDEIGQLSGNFNDFIAQIHKLVSQIVSSAIDIETATGKLRDTANKTNDGASIQRKETEMAATAMNEMSATADEVSRNASEAAGAAESVNTDGQSAIDILGQAISAIEALVKQIDSGSEAVNQVETDVSDIVTVLEVIRGIAEQTNLLALNAAIEAARAGEQGRGFAVVADEVRNLAGKTQGCTDEIQEMITRLQQGTEVAVNAMTQSREQGSSTVDLAHSANTSLNQIADGISTINDMNTQIASAAEEQTAVSREISESLDRISNVALDTANAAKDSEDLSLQMTNLGNEMKHLSSQFKV